VGLAFALLLGLRVWEAFAVFCGSTHHSLAKGLLAPHLRETASSRVLHPAYGLRRPTKDISCPARSRSTPTLLLHSDSPKGAQARACG
jgi:hypothetical protein